MSRYPSALGLARWAVRRPVAAVGLVRTRRLWATLAVLAGLPRPVRLAIVRPVDAVATLALRRQGDHAISAPLRVITTHLHGRTTDALGLAEQLGRTGSSRTAIRLARLAMALEAPVTANAILAAHPPRDDDPSTTGLRGEVAFAMGSFGIAMAHVEAALAKRPGDAGLRRVAAHAHGELALLDLAWRPAHLSVVRRAEPTRGRILHLLTNSLPYRQAGYTFRAQEMARAQRAVGLEPHLVTRAGFPGNEGVLRAGTAETIGGVPYHRIRPTMAPGRPLDEIADDTAAGLRALVERLRPAVLQPTTNYVNAQVALAVGEASGLPVVYEVRGFLEETWLSRMGEGADVTERYAAAREVETAMMRRASAVVTLSETMRSDILARGGIDPADVVVIGNAVDVDRFTPGDRDQALAAELGIDPNETVIGCVSSLVAYEGLHLLIGAVAILRAGGRRVRLLIVGDGDALPNLRLAARAAGLTEDRTAIFTGRVPHDQVVRYHRTIDVFVLPRTNDRVSRLVSPLKPFEAMATATAIVVSDVPALLEIVDDGSTGRTFRTGDVDHLATVLDGLVGDPDTRRRLGEAARVWVAANRRWAGNGARYLELYRRLGVA